MTMNPVGWFEIYVEDTGRARAFYEAVLGPTLQRLDVPATGDGPAPELWAFRMTAGAAGAAGALVRMPGFPVGRNSTLVYFSCADCATEAARVAAAGGRVRKPKASIGPYGFIALAFDTEGNLFGLHSRT